MLNWNDKQQQPLQQQQQHRRRCRRLDEKDVEGNRGQSGLASLRGLYNVPLQQQQLLLHQQQQHQIAATEKHMEEFREIYGLVERMCMYECSRAKWIKQK